MRNRCQPIEPMIEIPLYRYDMLVEAETRLAILSEARAATVKELAFTSPSDIDYLYNNIVTFQYIKNRAEQAKQGGK